jgi:hypothetical protein
MSEHIPPVFIRTEEEDIREKADAVRGMSPAQRWHIIKGLCSFGAKAVAQHPDPQRTLGLKEPIPMAEHEVAKMKAAQTEDEVDKPRIKIDFRKGDSVRIKEGAFENFDGIVEEINPQKGLVSVTITIFGRATKVDLEYWQVEKV